MAKTTKCSVCNCNFPTEDIVKYKRKNYCFNCFEVSFSEEVVDQHYFYLAFQRMFDRKPSEQEWVQCRRLIDNKQSSGEWSWRKIEKVMTYVYEVEGLDTSEEYGVIGILPYHEYRADKFYEQYYTICDMVDEMEDTRQEEVHIYTKPYKQKSKKVELKSIDDILCWEDEDE